MVISGLLLYVYIWIIPTSLRIFEAILYLQQTMRLVHRQYHCDWHKILQPFSILFCMSLANFDSASHQWIELNVPLDHLT